MEVVGIPGEGYHQAAWAHGTDPAGHATFRLNVLADLLLMPVLPQALLALVRGHLVPFSFLTARHVLLLLVR